MSQTFGELIQQKRAEKAWTVQKLISELYITSSPAYVCKIERGKEIPSAEFIYRLARAFSIDPKELIDLAKKEKLENYKKKIDQEYNYPINI